MRTAANSNEDAMTIKQNLYVTLPTWVTTELGYVARQFP